MKLVTAMAAVAALAAGCSSTSKSSPTSTQRSQAPTVGDIVRGVEEASNQLKKTLTSLQIVVEGKSDVAKARDTYLADLKKLDAQVQAVRDSASDLGVRRDAYLKEWLDRSAAMKGSTVKEAAEKRRTELMSEFMTLGAKGNAVRRAFAPMHGALQDCGRYLESDATPAGAALLAPEYESIRQMEAEVSAAGGEYKAQLQKIADMLVGK